MTTIVWKNGEMAGDGLVTKNSIVCCYEFEKVFKFNAVTVGFCGHVVDKGALIAHLMHRYVSGNGVDVIDSGDKIQDFKNSALIHCQYKDKLFLVEDEYVQEIEKDHFWALGSGEDLAIGINHANNKLSAYQIVCEVCELDVHSGGKITCI